MPKFMRHLLVLGSLVLLVPAAADAGCVCRCVNGEVQAVCLHIPTKPAGYPEVMSATHSNLIAATVPISSRPGDAVSSGRFW